MNDIEYKTLSPWNARGVQTLALQDLKLGNFPNAESIADPNNPLLVLKGFSTIKSQPGNYTGAFVEKRLSGYMKTGIWDIAHEIDFATHEEKQILQKMHEAGELMPEQKLAIYGLVVSNTLRKPQQAEMTNCLLDVATDKGLNLGMAAINIVIHNNDPVRRIAVNHGFEFTGRKGVVGEVKGLDQLLYSKALVD